MSSFGKAFSVVLHRPGSTDSRVVRVLGFTKATSKLLEEFNVFTAGPYEDIIFLGESEAYAMANIGKEYAVYFPAGRYSIVLGPWVYAQRLRIKFHY